MSETEQGNSSRSSSRGSSFSLCHMTESAYAKVIFCEIQDSYPADSDVECLYQLSESIIPGPGDHVGLFRVGWEDLNECIVSVPCASTSHNASLVGDSYNRVTFKVEDLPKDDLEYYQFLYLTSDNGICGASTPFKFHNIHEDESVVLLSAENDFLEVNTSTTLLRRRLAETQKYVTLLETTKKELEHRVINLEIEHEQKIEAEKAAIARYEKFEADVFACLTSITEGTGVMPLPKCSESLEKMLRGMSTVVDVLSKDNASLKAKNSILQHDLSKVKAEFDLFKSKQLRAQAENTMSAESVRLSLEQLTAENAALKDEHDSLEKSLSDAKDLFRATEECKNLVRQELENVKKSKEEMASSMEDLRLLNSMLKKQVANNENAIREMEKVCKELEGVKQNFDLEKESWEKQRNELQGQIYDLTARLKEGAELYKKQFLEIRTLKKQLKSYESSKRKLSNDATVGSTYVRCSSSDSIPSVEGLETPPFTIQPLLTMSDSEGAVPLITKEKERESTCNSRPANLSAASMTLSDFSSYAAAVSTGNPAAPSAVEIASQDSTVEQDTHPKETKNLYDEVSSSTVVTAARDVSQQEEQHSHTGVNYAEESNTVPHSYFEVFQLPCPVCDKLISVYDNSTRAMDDHLLADHNQQLCPVCGYLFDKGLPPNYFKYHVENHFSAAQSNQ